MSESTPELGEGMDIDAAALDVETPADELPATSDADEYVDDATLGGTAGDNAGGAG